MNGRHRLSLPNMGMYLKLYEGVDHCPTYDQFSSLLYLRTNTTIEKISKNRAKMMIGFFDPPYLLKGLFHYSHTFINFARFFKIFSVVVLVSKYNKLENWSYVGQWSTSLYSFKYMPIFGKRN